MRWHKTGICRVIKKIQEISAGGKLEGSHWEKGRSEDGLVEEGWMDK